ncbi:methionyl-tRNA formyltransferase, partial [Parabacteroides sp. OttesenSCG-928-G06]|nr:methionyl-tRNA formyltransferase [Parabacteroides sp. OttesenSCG-928-G06]
YAASVGLPVLQPEKLRDEEFLIALRALQADLQIVVAFRMLPEVVWNMPRYGTFNLHGSLLPQYRGAAPINWAIINGDTETGVTTFFLTHEIDTGKIIKQAKLPIHDEDNVEVVHDALMLLGAELVVETVDLLLEGRVDAIPQEAFYTDPASLRPAPKIFKETCRIDWNQPVKNIYDFIRGLSPYPAAWTELVSADGNVQALKIFETEKIYKEYTYPAGTILSDKKSYIDIAVSDGFLRLISLQLSGKKRMSAHDFLNGFKQIDSYKVR